MARTPAQDAARKELLATGKYEEYINSVGDTDVRLKSGTSTSSTTPSSGKSNNATAPTKTVNYVEPEGPYPAIRGDAGGIGYSARTASEGIINQSPGWEGSVLDSDIVPSKPIVDPRVAELERALAEAQKAADANAAYERQLEDYRAEQERLAEAQRQKRVAALGKSRDAAYQSLDSSLDNTLSAYEGEGAAIAPKYYDQRNQVAAQSDVGAMNFAQFQASRGIKGSAAGLPDMYKNAALQNQVGAIGRQEAADVADLERRKSAAQSEYESKRFGVDSAYEADVLGANADIDAQTMQAYINQMGVIQAQKAADNSALGLTSTGKPTIEGQQNQNLQLERQAALVAAQYYNDIMAEIDRRAAINPNDPLIPYLYSARRQKIQTQAEQQAAAMAAASEDEQAEWDKAFKLFERTGDITSAEQAQILGLPDDATVADVDIARMNAATSRINATKQPATKEPSYSYNTDPNFQSEVADIMSGRATLQDVIDNSVALQKAYGYDGYMKLVQAATPKE